MSVERQISYSILKQKMMSFRGHANWAQKTLPGEILQHWRATQPKKPIKLIK
jgi:hypothetical protein